MTCKEWPNMFASCRASRLNAPCCRWYVNASRTYLLRESRWIFVSVLGVGSSRDQSLLLLVRRITHGIFPGSVKLERNYRGWCGFCVTLLRVASGIEQAESLGAFQILACFCLESSARSLSAEPKNNTDVIEFAAFRCDTLV
jgi:hypothetical protein